MKKIFLYLYPIEEYMSMLIFSDEFYKKKKREHPLKVLNECFEKRYREKGYQIVFLTYPDKPIYGIDIKNQDKIIYTDINFQDNSAYDENGKEKENFIPKYANEEKILLQLGNVDELVVGGYHFSDCVKRIAESALNSGINTIVDLDLTDIFFGLYYKQDYFIVDDYAPDRYKEYLFNSELELGEKEEFIEKWFSRTYDSKVFGFNEKKRHL